jgi:hypothetical protein
MELETINAEARRYQKVEVPEIFGPLRIRIAGMVLEIREENGGVQLRSVEKLLAIKPTGGNTIIIEEWDP